MNEVIYKRKRVGALTKGLDTRSPNAVCAAAYLNAELNGFPKISEDFTYDAGFGMDSEAIRRFTLPPLFYNDNIRFKDYSEFEEDVKAGERLAEYVGEAIPEYENIQDIALYLYDKQEDDIPPGMTRKVEELRDRSEKMEEHLSEIERKLAT